MDFVSKESIASNLLFLTYTDKPLVFGLLQSKVHMAWVKTVCGRMKSDYRYSVDICYNAFPFPANQEKHEDSISEAALGVVAAREKFPDWTLAQLYDPDYMPNPLREAHDKLDSAVDEAYKPGGFQNDDERLEHLFKMYEELTTND